MITKLLPFQWWVLVIQSTVTLTQTWSSSFHLVPKLRTLWLLRHPPRRSPKTAALGGHLLGQRPPSRTTVWSLFCLFVCLLLQDLFCIIGTGLIGCFSSAFAWFRWWVSYAFIWLVSLYKGAVFINIWMFLGVSTGLWSGVLMWGLWRIINLLVHVLEEILFYFFFLMSFFVKISISLNWFALIFF